jgi:NDP-sugar pyrophosphorylase family protein
VTLPVAILAGGLAMRIRPLTEKTPKSLLDIAGRPFIDHQLSLLRKNGMQKIVLCLGFLGEQVEAFVGNGTRWELEVTYSYDGPSLAGTGGAIKKALPLLGKDFFVMYGDSYLPIDYKAVERAYREASMPALMTVYKNEGRWDSSNVVFIPSDKANCCGTVKFYSKEECVPGMDYIDYGLSCFSADIFSSEKKSSFDIADLYSKLINDCKLAAFEVKERFYEVGSFEGIKDLTSLFESN